MSSCQELFFVSGTEGGNEGSDAGAVLVFRASVDLNVDLGLGGGPLREFWKQRSGGSAPDPR